MELRPQRMIPAACLALLLSIPSPCGCRNAQDQGAGPESTFEEQRTSMVVGQIKGRGIEDERVLSAMQRVERHLFVPPRWRQYAYIDNPLPIGHDQTISQPYIVALMTVALDLQPTDKVLEIGTGSGYQAAILAELADSVFTIEIVDPLGVRAQALLDSLEYRNVKVKIGDGYQGWEEHAPFDAIIVTCAPTDIPLPLQEQLKEGGRMIIPVGETHYQRLVYLTKEKGELYQRDVIPVRFVPMVDESGKKY